MYTFIIYMVKVSVYLTAFYIVYSLFLSRDTSYSRNRFFILASFMLSLMLPFIKMPEFGSFDLQFFGKVFPEVRITGEDSAKSIEQTWSLPNVINILYIIVSSALLLKTIFDLISIHSIIIRNKTEDSRIIRFNGFRTCGFSAMGYIFIDEGLSSENASRIILHEKYHLEKRHFFDIVFLESLKIIQWFNPAIYLFDRSLRAVHEYQVDQDCLKSGIPAAYYQNLMLCQVFKSGAFNLSNSFSYPSLIKKRMLMMTKKRTSPVANFKLFTLIPVLAFVSLALQSYHANPSATDNLSKGYDVLPAPPATDPDLKAGIMEDSQEPFVVVEEMPMFPGGEKALMSFVAENTLFPQAAKEKNIQGKVIVRFAISAEGRVEQATILKGVCPELDNEAIRVVNLLPQFTPGKQGGKPVPVWYMIPIAFTLK